MNLSLCGCGFLGVYHLGVAACLREHGSSFLRNIQRVGGASAGSLVGCMIVADVNKVEVTIINVPLVCIKIYFLSIEGR